MAVEYLEYFEVHRKILQFSAGRRLETMSGKMIERLEIEFKSTVSSVFPSFSRN
jgi:hypothetical protein